MTLKLYHFMDAQYLVDSILKNRMKLSTFHNLNDPYEVMPDMVDENGCHAPAVLVRHHTQSMLKNTGLFCMSSKGSSPAMWAHYANRHRGAALELHFDGLNDGDLLHVNYSDQRVVDSPELDLSIAAVRDKHIPKILRTKAKCWEYEDEYRWVFPMSRDDVFLCDDGLLYRRLPEQLKRIILGFDCKILEGLVRKALDQVGFCDVRVARAKLSESDFNVVIDP